MQGGLQPERRGRRVGGWVQQREAEERERSGGRFSKRTVVLGVYIILLHIMVGPASHPRGWG